MILYCYHFNKGVFLMALSYKRTIIQVPLQDVKLFEDYAQKYSLSVSGAIIFLAKKSLEQEETIKYLPKMLKIIEKEQTLNNSKSSHNSRKSKK